MHNSSSAKNGFTLLEMAVALTIMGLIIGGIVFGKALIRNSELAAVVSEYAKYTQAIGQFKEKYNALPGDFAAATTLWGTAVDCASTATAGSGNNETCNGNGDGRVTTLGLSFETTAYEEFRAWQHLGNAQMVEGNYSGLAGTIGDGIYHRIPGSNVPASRLSGAGWVFITVTTHDITAVASPIVSGITYTTGDIKPNNLLWFGGNYLEENIRMSPILTASEALSFDQKIDDGKPQTGKVIAQSSSGLTTTCDDGSNYSATTSSVLACALVFKTDL